MKNFRYINDMTTLKLNQSTCIGCGMCAIVCPHGVFKIENRKAMYSDKDACMECGACMKNCPVNAIGVKQGVGCALYIIQSWFIGDKAACGCCDE